jgi:hypothetical protein
MVFATRPFGVSDRMPNFSSSGLLSPTLSSSEEERE